ncbi:MAG: hypothetical protein IH991_08695 [Planctomycetes bacterium]|nr:hypothetical protein [Planctomycetota bacterium]
MSTADALERVRDLEGFGVKIFDFDTNDFHAIPVTDDLIQRAREDRFGRTTARSVISLVPIVERITCMETTPEENADTVRKHEHVVVPTGASRATVHYRACIETHASGERIVTASEWAERLLAGKEDELGNTWIGECIVFRASGDALVVDRAQNPILGKEPSLSLESGEDDVIEENNSTVATRLAGRAAATSRRAISTGVLRLKAESWMGDGRLEAEAFAASPLAEFLFRDRRDALVDFMRTRNISFKAQLDSGALVFKPPAYSVSVVFFGVDIVVSHATRPYRSNSLSLSTTVRSGS